MCQCANCEAERSFILTNRPDSPQADQIRKEYASQTALFAKRRVERQAKLAEEAEKIYNHPSAVEARALFDGKKVAAFKQFPPPSECEKCGERLWNFISVSPNGKSAKYACGYCKKMAVVKANDIAARAANQGREPIPKEIQREVWRRDNGKCVVCGNQENLEFDHIIAVTRGGATSVRNLQLLCQTCNRKKSAKEPGNH
jgi:hypothetical protein